MKLPWNKKPARSTGRLAIAIDGEAFSYVEVAGRQIVRSGSEPCGTDSPQQLAKRVRALGLPGAEVITVLGLSDCQLLQIEAPAVPADEMKAAALMVHGTQCLLTICANGELFYARRLDWNSQTLGDMPTAAPVAAPAQAKTHGLMTMELEGVDIVDYGAEPDDTSARETDSTPRLAVEVQRSLDAWERSWPDLPLHRLWVQAEDRTQALQGLLMRTLSITVEAFDSSALFSALPTTEQPSLVLLGGLLRDDTRPH